MMNPPSPSPQNILILSDDAEFAAAMRRFLGRLRVEITVTPTAAEGLHHLREHPETAIAILAPAARPEGREAPGALFPALRRLAPRTRIVFLAPVGDYETAANARQAGADLAAAQPVVLGSLMIRLKEFLTPHRSTAVLPLEISAARAENPSDDDVQEPQVPALPPDFLPGDFPAELEMTITDISASGLGLHLGYPLNKGARMLVRAPGAMKKAGLDPDTRLPVRILNCREIAAGKHYICGSEFVSLDKDAKNKIRAFCRK